MRQLALPLALAAIAMLAAAVLFQGQRTLKSIQDLRPKQETQQLRIMNPQEICLEKAWCNTECGTVTVKTTFREEGHENETHAEFVARHQAAIKAMMNECPENC